MVEAGLLIVRQIEYTQAISQPKGRGCNYHSNKLTAKDVPKDKRRKLKGLDKRD
jgi:hypothetical protein